MSGRRDAGEFRVRPGGSARLAAARLRRARPRPILARPPVQATPPCVPPHRRSIDSTTVKEPHTKPKKHFPLELRAKTR